MATRVCFALSALNRAIFLFEFVCCIDINDDEHPMLPAFWGNFETFRIFNFAVEIDLSIATVGSRSKAFAARRLLSNNECKNRSGFTHYRQVAVLKFERYVGYTIIFGKLLVSAKTWFDHPSKIFPRIACLSFISMQI